MNQLRLTTGELYWLDESEVKLLNEAVKEERSFVFLPRFAKTYNLSVIHSFGIPDYLVGIKAEEIRINAYGVYIKTPLGWFKWDKKWKPTKDNPEKIPSNVFMPKKVEDVKVEDLQKGDIEISDEKDILIKK